MKLLGWALLLGMGSAPWRSPWKSVHFCHCPISSSPTEEQAGRTLQGPVLAIPPPCAGHPRAVIAQRHGYPKAAVVWNWRFFSWAHSHTSSTQSWGWGSCCVQGAPEWTEVQCHEIVECVENVWKEVSWPCFAEQKMAFPMVEILAEHSFSRYWAKVSGLMGLLKGRSCVTSGAMKSCSCISPFCDTAQHARHGEDWVHWKEGLALQSHATSQA